MKTIRTYRSQTNIGIFCIFCVLVLFTYGKVLNTFYQQDEWQTVGHLFLEGAGAIYDPQHGHTPLRLFFATGRILSTVMYVVLYSLKKFSVVPIFLFSLIVHTLNSFLVYLLTQKVTRNHWIGFVAGVFFAVNNVGSEAVTWAAAVGTVPATALFLLSLYWYVKFLDKKKLQARNTAFILGILSLLFKETGLFVFVLYPLLYAIWNKTGNVKTIISVHLPLLLYGAAMIAYRVGGLFFAQHASPGFVGGQGKGFVFPVVYHSIVYPLTSLFQVFVVPSDLYAFVPKVVRSEYSYLTGTPLFDLAGQSAVADVVSLLGTSMLLAAFGVMVWKERGRQKNGRLVTLGLLVLFCSFMPYVVLHRFFSYFSSRYYYVGVAGASFVFGFISLFIWKRLPTALRVVFVFLLGLYGAYHIQATHRDLALQVNRATERKTFLHQIKRLHPALGDQTIFYVTSDKKYLGEITYPFQNGLGYILELWYFDTGKIPKEFIRDNFLWDLGDEGYRISGSYGFGYFEHLDKLGELIRDGSVTPDIVYGYVYNSQTQNILDVTLSVRQQLSTISGELR